MGRGLWVSQFQLRWLGFELCGSWRVMVGCGGSGAKDCGGLASLEFWILLVFFFFCCDWCLKEEVGMAKLGMAFCYWFDLILEWIFFFFFLGSWWWSWGCRGLV